MATKRFVYFIEMDAGTGWEDYTGDDPIESFAEARELLSLLREEEMDRDPEDRARFQIAKYETVEHPLPTSSKPKPKKTSSTRARSRRR